MSEFRLFDQAGWYEGRCVDITDDVRALREDGYAVWPAVEALLAEFSGLRVWNRSVVELGAAVAIESTMPEDSRDYETFAGQRLAPIGCYSAETIYLGEDDRLYAGFADLFGELAGGGDLKATVEGLLLRRPGLPLREVPGMADGPWAADPAGEDP